VAFAMKRAPLRRRAMPVSLFHAVKAQTACCAASASKLSVSAIIGFAFLSLVPAPAYATYTRGDVSNFRLAIAAAQHDKLPDPSPALPSGSIGASSPSGFAIFCLRFADQCETAKDASSTIGLTENIWLLLERVNVATNRAIRPMDDERHYGRPEYWTIPTDGFGDCEDYALSKRKALIEAGLPARALRIAVVITPTSVRHAVLTVSTDRGDFVLDNLHDQIEPWQKAGYVWIERQAPNDVRQWVALAPMLAPMRLGLRTGCSVGVWPCATAGQ